MKARDALKEFCESEVKHLSDPKDRAVAQMAFLSGYARACAQFASTQAAADELAETVQLSANVATAAVTNKEFVI